MKTLKEFHQYVNDFYGTDGIYPSHREITLEETQKAINHIGNNFQGDSVDRETARDFIFTAEEVDALYNAPISQHESDTAFNEMVQQFNSENPKAKIIKE